ncbi:MAG: EAL domain-containing protein [Giesbergeria sp.]|uniref:putative bifunctional diguanylate cyclase/phosphodiesterase n=1 Tax=Giesbergeria sp. TaxID=2818473 RepID=UPI0026191DA2|nr:EAL domain-containing protein [Giesbergeria sp.]MDD2609704.1 EAL domain-containing protein [Giesbergeria sp.]
MNFLNARAVFSAPPEGDAPALPAWPLAAPLPDSVAEVAALRATLEQTRQELERAQRQLREQAQVFQAMEDLARAGYWWRMRGDNRGGAYWSPGLCHLAGFAEQDWVSCAQGRSGILADDEVAFEKALRRMDGQDLEYRWQRPDGQVRRLRIRMCLHHSPDGSVMELGVVLDVTDSHQVAAQLREQLDFIQRIASRIPGFIYQYRIRPDGTACVPYISDAVQDLLGVSPQAAMQDLAHLESKVDASDLQRMRLMMARAVHDLQPWQCEYRVHAADGSVRWHMSNAVLQKEPDGSVLLHGYTLDLTERKQAEEEIERLAFYDALTGLPNRRLLLNRLEHSIAVCLRKQQRGALLFIDLDNFKDLNDTQGHDVGDLLLTQVAQRLVAVVRDADTVARFGGDEFVIMLDGLSADLTIANAQAETVAEKLLRALNTPYTLAGALHYSTPSIGVTLFGDERHSVDELLKRADLAMYQAKAAGRNTQRFFDPAMQAALLERSSLEADLRLGLERGELFALYQPVVNHRGQVLGAEALARWKHPERGMISPADFIPLAEQTGLILPLGRHILQLACTQLVAWAADRQTAHLSVAVNVSARQFRQPSFVSEVLETLKQTGANPQRLKIELTESMLLGDLDATIARMEQLKRQGVGFALDDFGTGYSSLSYLKRLPLDQVKIDQSFVRDVLTDPNDAAIVRTILALAQSLDLVAVAEGVETTGQMGFLRLHGCEQFQGYLFGRPGSAQALQSLMHAQP